MVYGKLEEIGKYRNLSKWFAYAADFLEKTDLNDLPQGRTEICGKHVFINVMEADTADEKDVFFEIHKKYWDVQIDIKGTERIQVAVDKGRIVKEFSEEIDFGTYDCKEFISCIMGPGRFIICMDEEPHKPTLNYADCDKVKKCVIKVEVE